MEQNKLSNRFLEQTVFAIADGYCSIDLTKNVISGVMHQVIDGKDYDLNEQIGMPADSSFTDIVPLWAQTLPEEERPNFLRTLDRDMLLERFQNGENHISFTYWTRTATFEPMLAEDHLAMFRDAETGDVMAVNYVFDRTEQFRLKEQGKQLTEKNKQLEKLLDLERQYSGLLSALSKIYLQIFTIDLTTGMYREIQSQQTMRANRYAVGQVQPTFFNAVKAYVAEGCKNTMFAFLDYDTLPERLSKSESISAQYMNILGTWCAASFIVQERNADGTATRVLFAIQDIDEQKRSELERQRLEEMRLETMAEAIHGGFKLGRNDSKFSFIRVSDQLAQLLGYDSAVELTEATGGCMSDIVNHEDTARELPQAMKAVEAGEMYTMHYRVRCKDGGWKNVEDRGRLFHKPDGEEEFWSFIVDQDEFTKKSEALDAANRANQALQRVQNDLKTARDEADAANQAKSTFLFNMSHDIRTPMNAIVGYTELLEKHSDDQERCADYIRKIRSSGAFLLSLINNVLEMARIESGKAMLDEIPVMIGEITNEISAVYEEIMRQKNIKFIRHIDVQSKYIYCDQIKVKQIILNLISNAFKYTPQGGSVSMKITELPCEKLGCATICTEISDNGIGMSEEYLPTLFEEFSREKSTTDNRIEGTGLGMAIVKKLVNLMGGTITVKSELGKGTTFSVVITHRIADKKDIHAEDTVHVDTNAFQGKRILLAEDNDMNAEIACEILKEYGFETDRAADGVICIDMLEKASVDYYDLILMDIQMPNMDGYQAARIIRTMDDETKKHIPIIAMTANAFDADRKDALAVGMNGHLSKPIDMAKFLETLSVIL